MTTEAWSNAFEFFSYTRKAHLDAAALTLARLLDNRRDVVSLRQLARMVDAEAGGFGVPADHVRSTIIPQNEREIAALIEMSEPIKQRRDEIMAHNAVEQPQNSAVWMMEFSDLEQALGKVLTLVNDLRAALDGHLHT